MSASTYGSYRESGIEWLGQVPSHWSLAKLRYLADFVGGGTPSRDKPEFWGGDVPWVSPKDMKTELILGAQENITEEGLAGSSSSLIEPGAVLMVVRSGILQHTIPVAQNAVPVALNQDMKALRFNKECSPAFFVRWVQGLNNQLLLAWAKQGATVESIEHAYLADSIVPLPPPAEQAAIVAFLDRETGKIDALVEAQARLIELLKEKRQAVISHAVTKGLDPAAAMKDSGVEWLGQVPAHWEITRLKHIGEAITGLTYTPDDIVTSEDDGTLVLRSSNVQRGRISLSDNVYVSREIPDKLRARKGDILICSRNGSRALIGKNAHIDSSVAGETWGAFMTVFRTPHSNFLYWVLNSEIFSYQAATFLTSTINQLTIGDLNSFAVPLPPEAERKQIATRLVQESSRLDALVFNAERAVALLQERRAALISAAVTGKIDVRGIAPEQAEAA